MTDSPATMPTVLSVAGSDSGGGAGIQADLKAWSALGVFGATAITCLTAQNPDEVSAVEAVSPAMVEAQIRAVCRGFPVAAAKTGMLYCAATIQLVARIARERVIPVWVVDPVMIATSGARLLQADALRALREELLPQGSVLTPNLPEAEELWGRPIRSTQDLGRAAREIGQRYKVACLAKGGHLKSAPAAGAEPAVVDVLWDGRDLHAFYAPRLNVAQTHGTGCTFSAALTAGLARNLSLPAAARAAQQFVGAALRHAVRVGRHTPLNPTRPAASAPSSNPIP
jgi:hydroxymethylpyrimidine/phosphomethylpyrimidine kinase